MVRKRLFFKHKIACLFNSGLKLTNASYLYNLIHNYVKCIHAYVNNRQVYMRIAGSLELINVQ